MAEKIEKTRRLKKADGTVAITWDGKLHSWDEPALVHPTGKKEYYIHTWINTRSRIELYKFKLISYEQKIHS